VLAGAIVAAAMVGVGAALGGPLGACAALGGSDAAGIAPTSPPERLSSIHDWFWYAHTYVARLPQPSTPTVRSDSGCVCS
jgi:hypothetical protein